MCMVRVYFRPAPNYIIKDLPSVLLILIADHI